MRDLFLKTFMNEAAANPNAMLVTGDLGFGVLDPFIKQYPAQYLNAGVSEQNMVGLATGMAQEGRRVVCYSIGNFPTLRPLEQIRNDAAYHNADVKIVCVGGGFSYGALGMSHHATEDLSILRALPNVCVLTPATDAETIACTQHMMRNPGVFYLRLERASAEIPDGHDDAPVEIGRLRSIISGNDVIFIAAGGVLGAAILAAQILQKDGISAGVVSAHTIKPFDSAGVRKLLGSGCRAVITVEENTILGGLGGAVCEIAAESGIPLPRLARAGINDTYTSIVGDQAYLKNLHGLAPESLAQRAKTLLNT